jgi:hypothetical protein
MAKGIPLGMHRSVEMHFRHPSYIPLGMYPVFNHFDTVCLLAIPYKDTFLTECGAEADAFSTERYIPDGMCVASNGNFL